MTPEKEKNIKDIIFYYKSWSDEYTFPYIFIYVLV